MKPIKHLYLHFSDGQRLALRFPQQSDDPAEVARGIRKQMESPVISIEVDGDLLIIPRTSIKYLQISPAPMRMPETTGAAMVPLVANRIRVVARGSGLGLERLRKRRARTGATAAVGAEELARIDILWSMAVGLAIVDPIRGADFQTRHLLRAIDSGEPYRIACALAAEAGFTCADGPRKRERTEWLLAEGARMAEEAGQANAFGYLSFARALADVGPARARGAEPPPGGAARARRHLVDHDRSRLDEVHLRADRTRQRRGRSPPQSPPPMATSPPRSPPPRQRADLGQRRWGWSWWSWWASSGSSSVPIE